MVRLLPALLLTMASWPAAAQGQAAAGRLPPCEQPVRFSAGWFASPERDNGKSAAELTKSGSGTPGSGKALQLGHVVVETRLTVVPQATCRGVVVRLQYLKPVLRVASEFPPGGCPYAHVMNHELTHVQIHRDIAQQFRELAYPFAAGGTDEAVLLYARQELDRLLRAQALFDSPEEYARNHVVCRGEITRLLKPAG